MIETSWPDGAPYDLYFAGDYSPQRRQSIERLAYVKWQANGSPRDSALRDWLDAEEEVDAAALQQSIERRAYDIWKWNGCPSGTAMSDWLEAEQEIALESSVDWNVPVRGPKRTRNALTIGGSRAAGVL
jgi:hypothetical protein